LDGRADNTALLRGHRLSLNIAGSRIYSKGARNGKTKSR
jgi:hypothetical protein